MPKYTNTKEALLHAGGVMLIPATPVDLPDEVVRSPLVQHWIKEGRLKEGEVEVAPEVPQDDGPPKLKNASPNDKK